MTLVTRIVWAYLRQERWRLATTTAAIVAAGAVVVWVVAGYDALLEQVEAAPEEYLGRANLVVAPTSSEPFAEGELVGALRADPAVASAEPVLQVRVGVGRSEDDVQQPRDSSGRKEDDGGYGKESAYIDGDNSARPERPGGRAADLPVLVVTDAAEPPRNVSAGRWLADGPTKELDGSETSGKTRGRKCVLSTGAAERIGVALGDEIVVETERRAPVTLRIVGIVLERKSAALLGETLASSTGEGRPEFGAGPAGRAIFVRSPVAAQILGKLNGANAIEVSLRPGQDAQAFRKRWDPRLAEAKPAARLIGIEEVQTALGQGARTRAVRAQSYAATGISLLASLFIIFSTLSMGVTERMRQLAVLRAVALTRGQIARIVFGEALVLGTLGWLGGLTAGWILLALSTAARPGLSLSIGGSAVALSAACAYIGALAAGIVPAWSASRVDIVASLSARPTSSRPSYLGRLTLAGLVLLAFTPIILEVLPLSPDVLVVLFGAVGLPAILIGFLLLTPAFVVGVERVFGPLLARALGLPPQFLRAQLGSHLPRTVGVTLALSVGLGLFVTIQVWGYTMLGPFLPGGWAPVTVHFTAGDLPVKELERIAALPVIKRVQRMATEQPVLAADITGAATRGKSVVRQDNIVLLGVEPRAGLGGDDPLLKLNFVKGTAEEAIRRLESGGHCVIPDHFAVVTGLGIGDSFEVVPPTSPEKRVKYTVAGIVNLPGWHFVSKEAGLRWRLPRAAALVFTGRSDIERDFELDPARFDLVALELREGTTIAELTAALGPIAEAHAKHSAPNRGLQIMNPASVREALQFRTDTFLWGASELPLITLLVASLAVMNAVLASIRARRWELGVLRSIGVTRGALVRMVIAEGILVGVIACAVSLSFGFSASWAGVAVTQHVSYFGGLAPPMVVPWAHVIGGTAAALVLCLAAAVWPAVMIGRADTLALLREGRATM